SSSLFRLQLSTLIYITISLFPSSFHNGSATCYLRYHHRGTLLRRQSPSRPSTKTPWYSFPPQPTKSSSKIRLDRFILRPRRVRQPKDFFISFRVEQTPREISRCNCTQHHRALLPRLILEME